MHSLTLMALIFVGCISWSSVRNISTSKALALSERKCMELDNREFLVTNIPLLLSECRLELIYFGPNMSHFAQGVSLIVFPLKSY